MLFLKKTDLQLVNGGYLANQDEIPVTHVDFVKAQVRAHYLVNLAAKVFKANFKVSTPDTFEDLVKATKEELQNSDYAYVDAPEAPSKEITNTLKTEAMNWINFQGEKEATKRVNVMMQEFNIVKDFEEFGLYFTEGLVKLKDIYSISDIVEAVTTLEPHLD